MKKHSTFLILHFALIIMCFAACKKVPKPPQSGGKIVYKDESYALKNARCSNFGDEYSVGLNTLDLYFASNSINMSEDGISGTGTILALAMFSLSDTLPEGIYYVENSMGKKNILSDISYLQISSKEDTLTVAISGGYMIVENDLELNKRFEFHFVAANGDSITGNYAGAVRYNLLYDQPTVAQISVDTVEYQIQKGDFVRWGKLLDNSLYYYEIYFYSADLRRTDAGKIKSGFVLILGINSTSADFPPNGTYSVSKKYEDNTLFWGAKIGEGKWGTYWNLYKNGSSSASSNVYAGDISFERTDNNFKIILNLKDHNQALITGEYDNELKIKNIE